MACPHDTVNFAGVHIQHAAVCLASLTWQKPELLQLFDNAMHYMTMRSMEIKTGSTLLWIERQEREAYLKVMCDTSGVSHVMHAANWGSWAIRGEKSCLYLLWRPEMMSQMIDASQNNVTGTYHAACVMHMYRHESAKTFSLESASTAVEIWGQSALNAAPGRFSLTCSQLYLHSLQWESKMIYIPEWFAQWDF